MTFAFGDGSPPSPHGQVSRDDPVEQVEEEGSLPAVSGATNRCCAACIEGRIFSRSASALFVEAEHTSPAIVRVIRRSIRPRRSNSSTISPVVVRSMPSASPKRALIDTRLIGSFDKDAVEGRIKFERLQIHSRIRPR